MYKIVHFYITFFVHSYNIINKAREDARKEGVKEGINIGVERGLLQGITKGSKESKQEIAKAMLKEKMDINLIAKVTKLSIEEIEQLKD